MIITDHPALIRCSPDAVLWRYVNFQKFEKLLADRALFLCRSNKFSDPYEGSVPKREADYRWKEQMSLAASLGHPTTEAKAKQQSDQTADLHKRLLSAFIINCWHINSTESDAMWKLYLKSNEGVAVQTTYKRLCESLPDDKDEIMVSCVRYIDYEKDGWYHKSDYPVTSYNFFTPIVHKRIAFSHEKELRIFKRLNGPENDPKFWDSKPSQTGENLSCKVEILVEKIILPPTADDSVKAIVDKILDKYKLKVEVVRSKFDDPPIY